MGFPHEALSCSGPIAVGPAKVPTVLLGWLCDPVVNDELGVQILKETTASVGLHCQRMVLCHRAVCWDYLYHYAEGNVYNVVEP